MRAFVTGGTGLIGRPLVHLLLADGWDVTVLTRDLSRAKDLGARGADIVPGDVTTSARDMAASTSSFMSPACTRSPFAISAESTR